MMILKAVATLSVVGVGAAAAAFGGLHLGQAPAGAGPAAQPVKARAACTVAPAVKLAARPAAKRTAKPACGDHRRARAAAGTVHHRPAVRQHERTAAHQRKHSADRVVIRTCAGACRSAVAGGGNGQGTAAVGQNSNRRLHGADGSRPGDGHGGSHHGGHHGSH